MASMEGKVIAVTGAASGIGLATVVLLLERGAKVAAADVQQSVHEAVKTAADKIEGAEAISTIVDVCKPENIDEWMNQTLQKFGRLDGAANIAGVYKAFPDSGIEVEDESNWNSMLEVNLTGVMHCMRAQLQHIKSGGSIVNAASVLSLRGWSGAAAYSASKHGVVGLTKSASKDVGKRNIRVNCIAPGYIDTPMLAAAAPRADKPKATDAAPLGRAGQPREVACLIAFLLSDDASFITGCCYSVDGVTRVGTAATIIGASAKLCYRDQICEEGKLVVTPKIWLVVFVLSMGYGLSVWSITVLTAAQSEIATLLGNPANYVWYIPSWSLAITLSFLLIGANTDLFGRRWFLIGGNIICFVGQLIIADAKSSSALTVGAVTTRVGAAACQSAAFALSELNSNCWETSWHCVCRIGNLIAIVVAPVTARYGFYGK